MSSAEITLTAVAAADLSAAGSIGKWVRCTGSSSGLPQAQLMTDPDIADGQDSLGMLMVGAASGSPVTVLQFGPTELALAGAAITPGTDLYLTVDGTSRLVAASDNDIVVALFQGHRTAAAGDPIRVIVCQPFPLYAGATIIGALGGSDNVVPRSDGVGGLTLQSSLLVIDDAGAASGLTGLTMTGNITLSTGGATVDGVDLDTVIRGALGATDNIILRSDGAGGVTAQGGGVCTLSDAGAIGACTGLTLASGNITLSQAGATVDGRDLTVDGAIIDSIRKVTLAVGAEAGNAIAVTLNVVDGNGSAVNAATQLICRCWSPSATTIALTETGAGSQVFVTAAAVAAMICILTDASGDATLTITFTAAETVFLEVVPAPVSGDATHGFPVARDIAFA